MVEGLTGNLTDANGISGAYYVLPISSINVSPSDFWVGQGMGESIWSDIWNSPIARALVPDEIGVQGSITLVPNVGGGNSFNVLVLTRGKDAGFHMSQSLSARAGEEGGIGINATQGWFLGAGQNATYNSLTGLGADINGALGPGNVGIWTSLDSKSLAPTWIGTSAGTGWSVGGSGGVSYTWPIK
jgi:hypothetical protein